MSVPKRQRSGAALRLYMLEQRLKLMLGRVRTAECPLFAMTELKAAYFAVPKAANSSIKRALFHYISGSDRPAIQIHAETRPYLVSAESLFSEIDPSWFVFTVVRNPGDRALSAWRDKVRDHKSPFRAAYAMGMNSETSFETFLKRCGDWPVMALNDHFMPQSLLLRHALNWPGIRVFRTEALAEDWQVIRQELGARGATGLPQELGVHNATSVKSEEELMRPEIRRLLRSLYGTDYAELGYEGP